jgi:hypothetical protein
VAAALEARANRHAKRHALVRFLRRWSFTVACLQLDYQRNQLANDHYRQKTLGKVFPCWIDSARAALLQHIADQRVGLSLPGV